MSLEIAVSEVHIDGDSVPKADSEILLNFGCKFAVRAKGVQVFAEVEFPFVEFASQVATWLASGKQTNFDFDSMESAVLGLVYFHREEGGWNVGSMQEDSCPPVTVTDDELDRGLKSFLSFVVAAIDKFGVDVRPLVSLTPEP